MQTSQILKASWGPGPWQDELDRAEWEHAGLPCLARRSQHGGNWCGYVAVPPGHSMHGKDYIDVDVDVHGGLTYADKCDGDICHVPKPGESDDVWWFGFDCGHCWDILPGRDARIREIEMHIGKDDMASYKTLAYVQEQTNALADQLAALR